MPDQKRRKNFLYPRPKEGTDPTEQREFPYLPEAVNASFVIGGADAEAVPVKEGTPIPAPEPEPAEPPGKYPCPCCGHLTFPVPKEDALAYICPVCCWENDVFDPGEDAPSDENCGMTLRQGRENYQKGGAVREDLVRHARPPRPQERPKSGKIPS